MRLVTYQSHRGPRAAAFHEGAFFDLNDAEPALASDLATLLSQGPASLGQIAKAIARGKPIEVSSVRRLPPIPRPPKVICVGLNYADHARESGVEPPAEPVLFNKFPTTLIADGDPIVLPGESHEVDYEAELVAVIGRGGRHIPRAKALDHVAGYMCGHDVSARDWQLRKPGGQWLLGKSFDTFAPCGPHLVTSDEVGDPHRLGIRFRLNGQTLQDSNTAEFIFGIDELIRYVSQVCTLVPGDLLFTGTPSGVGFARKPPIFLQAGDVAEVEIEKLGVLRNPVIRAGE